MLWVKEYDVFFVYFCWVDVMSYFWSWLFEEDYFVIENFVGLVVVIFVKNVLVEFLIVDDMSDKGEVELLVDLEFSKDEIVF